MCRALRRKLASLERPHPNLTLLDAGMATLMGAISLALYVRTLYPGLLPSDSGELQVLARFPGNTHPTGYQVYVLLAWAFAKLPVGSIAYRVNLFSAAMGALTTAEVYLSGRLLAARRWPAVLAAMALSVSATFWSQAVIAEVYTPGAAFLAGVLLALLYWHRTRHAWALWVAGLLGGLSLGVHLTVALLAPAVVVFLLVERKADWPTWRTASFGALVGVALFVGAFALLDWLDSPADFLDIAVLPSRSVWGLDARQLDSPMERLAFSITARQWRDRMFADPSRVMPENAGWYIANLVNEYSLTVVLLCVLGACAMRVRRPRLAALLLGALCVQWVYTFNYEIHDLYVFHISGYVLLALLAASGGGLLADLWSTLRWSGWGRPVAAVAGVLVLLVLAIWPTVEPHCDALRAGHVPSFPFGPYPVGDDLELSYQLIGLEIRKLRPDALVFAEWRFLYPYYYIAYLEQGRTDLTFLEEKPYRPGQQQESSMLEYVETHIAERPVYFEHCLEELVDAGYRCRPVPTGSIKLYRLLPP
jgi:hypothetical protein